MHKLLGNRCGPRLARAAALAAFTALGACGGDSNSAAPISDADPTTPTAPGPGTGPSTSIPLGEPGPTSYAHMLDYLDVVTDPALFDECLTTDPAGQPYLCLPGPRTGSALAHAVHDWAAHQLRGIDGITDVQRQAFTLPRFAPRDYGLSVDTPDGVFQPAVFPWYFQGTTAPGGVIGELVDLGGGSLADRLRAGDLTGKIVVFSARQIFNAQTVGTQNTLDRVAEAGAAGAVVAVDGPGNALVAQNYDIADGPRDLPTLIVGQRDGTTLADLAGATARLTVDAAIEPAATSYNAVGFLPGVDRDNLLVIGTPVNGWFTVGSERGPGVGGLIYLARYLADRARRDGPLPYTVAFAFTGGHEVFGFGQERLLRCLDPARAAAYVHLGAGLASRGYVELGGEAVATGMPATQRALVVSENPMLQAMTVSAFGPVVAAQAITVSGGGTFNPGETRASYALRIPTVGMSGAGEFHHTPADDASRVDVAYLGPVMTAFRDVTDALLAADPASLRQSNALADSLAGDPPGYACPGPIRVP